MDTVNDTLDHKVFFDSVHGHMTFHPLCIDIIDTPEFQRLRNIKQTSVLYYVFPGASHNRFEHCLGTAYLSNALVTSLKKNQPELNITDADILCVTIAGLCHDVGHGPFSHTWERFMCMVNEDSTWTHEQASVKMVDYMIKSNNLDEKFVSYGLRANDVVFIKELILGEKKYFTRNNSPLNMRDSNKDFLFEIVNNKRCGIDVDKWDYFLRDTYNLGMKCNCDYQRFILFSRVINIDGKGLQICLRDKEIDNLYNMFYVRWDLNRRAYRHKVASVIDQMICDAFSLANPYLLFPGQKRNVTMFEASETYDMKAFSKMTDHIFQQIVSSCDENLHDAKVLLERIQRRKLYTCVGQAMLANPCSYVDCAGIKVEIMDIIEDEKSRQNYNNDVKMADFMISVCLWDYGMSDENPVDKVNFYSKYSRDAGKPIRKSDISKLLPNQFKESALRMIVKPNDDKLTEFLKSCFQSWCTKHNLNPI